MPSDHEPSPSGATVPPPVEPDGKDWTWVLRRPCPDCGFDAAHVSGTQVPDIVRDCAARWPAVLSRPDAARRPASQVWSPLEYACHVRDVCRVFAGRLQQMLREDDARFANWDQDATAVEERYWEQVPAVVAGDLTDAAEDVAALFDAVTEEEWDRTGRRSDGSVFTVETLGQYFVHDLVHHVHDVGA